MTWYKMKWWTLLMIKLWCFLCIFGFSVILSSFKYYIRFWDTLYIWCYLVSNFVSFSFTKYWIENPTWNVRSHRLLLHQHVTFFSTLYGKKSTSKPCKNWSSTIHTLYFVTKQAWVERPIFISGSRLETNEVVSVEKVDFRFFSIFLAVNPPVEYIVVPSLLITEQWPQTLIGYFVLERLHFDEIDGFNIYWKYEYILQI